MTTKNKLEDTLRLLGQALPEQVEVGDLPDGSITIHYLPSKPEEGVSASWWRVIPLAENGCQSDDSPMLASCATNN
jgi:hypothetical protein